MEEARARTHGSGSVSAFIRLENEYLYARLLREAGRTGESEASLRTAVDELQGLVGARHVLLGRIWRELALIEQARGDIEAAQRSTAQALDAGIDETELRDTALASLPDFDKIVTAAQGQDGNGNQ